MPNHSISEKYVNFLFPFFHRFGLFFESFGFGGVESCAFGFFDAFSNELFILFDLFSDDADAVGVAVPVEDVSKTFYVGGGGCTAYLDVSILQVVITKRGDGLALMVDN